MCIKGIHSAQFVKPYLVGYITWNDTLLQNIAFSVYYPYTEATQIVWICIVYGF